MIHGFFFTFSPLMLAKGLIGLKGNFHSQAPEFESFSSFLFDFVSLPLFFSIYLWMLAKEIRMSLNCSIDQCYGDQHLAIFGFH